LLPARTRYEQPGGGTETSTERRIYFSPEIPGRRVGESRAEWEILTLLAEHAFPERAELIHFLGTEAIRDEIARAVPAYAGIESLRKKGDAVQWGGRLLCRDGMFPTADGRARFIPLHPPDIDLPEGHFLLSARRGKQFNSMVQGERDPLVGATRSAVLMSQADATALGLREGAAVVVRSDVGELAGHCRIVAIKPRNVQVYWPEANALIRWGVTDPQCGIPDYHTLVQIIPAGAAASPNKADGGAGGPSGRVDIGAK
jgi:predicted molibdopterin-dependent oxidoreductase YjgC